jgi:hypothetical protein
MKGKVLPLHALRSDGREATWLICLDLACAGLAGAVWYAFPRAGAWPLLVALIPWALRWVFSGRLVRRTAFDLPLTLFLLTAAVGVWTAFIREAAMAKFWLIVAGILLFYALSHAEPLVRGRIWLLAVFGAGVAAYFVATHNWDVYPAKIAALTQLGRSLQSVLPPLPGHRLHPNVAGGILAMLIPFSALITFWSGRELAGVRRSGAGSATLLRGAFLLGAACATFALTLFGLVMSTSRGAWIALAVAALVLALWGLVRHLARGRPTLRAWALPALLVLLLVGAVVAALAWEGGWMGLLAALPGPNTAIPRIELLKSTLTLVRDYPLVGAGLGSFQMLYSTYVLLLHVGYTIHSHNLLLNVAVEQGLPAMLLLAWMWLLAAVAVSRLDGLRGGPAPRAASEALIAAAASLIVFLVHGQVDDVLYGSRAILLLFLPLAFCVPFLAPSRARSAYWRPLAVPAGIALVLGLALIWRRPVLSTIYSNLGAVHQHRAELSGYTWPEWPIQDAVRRAVDLSRPIAEFRTALGLDPRNATANRRLGMIELSLGQYGSAVPHLEAAYAAEPGSATTRQLLGEAYLANGRLADGRTLWSTLPDAQGQLAARAFWYGYLGDNERAQWMQDAASRP